MPLMWHLDLVIMFVVNRRTPLGAFTVALALLSIGLLIVLGSEFENSALSAAAVTVAAVVCAWASVVQRRDRRRYEQQLRRLTASEAAHQARMSFASELHDLVSQGLGLITLRASTASRLTTLDEMRTVLSDIESTSRSATAELRRLLDLLREGEAKAETLAANDLENVLEQGRSAGLIVDSNVTTTIHRHAVACTLALVVREALSNVARHAGVTRVHVTVDRFGDQVRATISDEGPADGWVPAPGTGTGLSIMRERCRQVGGSLKTHAAPSGFTVMAVFPDAGAS